AAAADGAANLAWATSWVCATGSLTKKIPFRFGHQGQEMGFDGRQVEAQLHMAQDVVADLVVARERILHAVGAAEAVRPLEPWQADVLSPGLAELFVNVHLLAAEAAEVLVEPEPGLAAASEQAQAHRGNLERFVVVAHADGAVAERSERLIAARKGQPLGQPTAAATAERDRNRAGFDGAELGERMLAARVVAHREHERRAGCRRVRIARALADPGAAPDAPHFGPPEVVEVRLEMPQIVVQHRPRVEVERVRMRGVELD